MYNKFGSLFCIIIENIFCDVALGYVQQIWFTFLFHKVNLERLRPANTLLIFRIGKRCTRPRILLTKLMLKWRRNPLDVCMKFRSDLVNRFISLARCNTGGLFRLRKETNIFYANTYMCINVSLSTRD
jgi:hypothetical protein